MYTAYSHCLNMYHLYLQAGHVYICDLKIMDGLPCKDVSYCAAPLCLLYVDNNNNLVPIAIQLKQTPGSENPIFLPSDHWADGPWPRFTTRVHITRYKYM